MADWVDHRAQVVADFRQFYGMSLPVGADDDPPDPEMYSVLWTELPPESRCARREVPDLAWGDAEYLLRSIDYSLRVIAWQRTKDGARGRNAPSPCPTPGEAARRRDAAERSRRNADSIARQLGYDPGELRGDDGDGD